MTRPKHWMDFAPFKMAHEPLKMTIEEAQIEVDKAWRTSYSAAEQSESTTVDCRPAD